MIGMNGERESGKHMLSARLDDDNDWTKTEIYDVVLTRFIIYNQPYKKIIYDLLIFHVRGSMRDQVFHEVVEGLEGFLTSE